MKKINFRITTLNHYQIALILLILAIILYTICLGNMPLRDWDEGYYGIVARDMVENNNWLFLTYLDEPFLLKPPLMIWLVAISYKLGGINEFTSRFPVAFITALGVPLIYLIGNIIFNEGNGISQRRKDAKESFGNDLPLFCLENRQYISLFTALVYLTLLPVVRHGRLAMMDGIIVTFFLFSIYCVLKSKTNQYYGIGVGLGLGCIALTKGVLVLLLGFIIKLFVLVNREYKLLKNVYLWLGIILGLMAVFSWYWLQYQQYGDTFINVHFKSQSFDRLSTAVEGNKGSIFYYVIELLKYTIPWLLFLPQGLILAWQNKDKPWGNLILIGFTVYLVTISLMGTKLPWYIMPIYPFFTLAVGVKLAQLYQQEIYPNWLKFVFYSLGGLMLGGIVYFVLSDPQIPLILMAILLSLTFILSAYYIQVKNKKFIPTLFIGLYLSFGLFFTSNSWNWEFNENFNAKTVGLLINHNTPEKTIIYTSFSYSRPSVDFYSDRPVIPANINQLQELGKSENYLLINAEILPQLNLINYENLGTAENFILIKS
jgi:4-amino-4-deoxy-L-arabinose transferase-like glycosyltransferase